LEEATSLSALVLICLQHRYKFKIHLVKREKNKGKLERQALGANPCFGLVLQHGYKLKRHLAKKRKTQ
jgi:hypothetical protein